MNEESLKDWMTVEEAALTALVAVTTVYAWIKDKKIERVKLGNRSYIKRSSLVKFLKNRGEELEEPHGYLHIQTVARLTGVTTDAVLRWIRAKRVIAVKYKKAYWVEQGSLRIHLGPVASSFVGLKKEDGET